MKIGVVGSGALGGYYGARLGRDGHQVHFLSRSDHDAVKRRGVFVSSPEGDFHFRPRVAREPRSIGACDLVVIGLKTTANDRLCDAGVPCQVTDNLARAHWEKLVWNIPFNGLGVAALAGIESCRSGELTLPLARSARCAATDVLLADPDWTDLVRELMSEVVATANALGLKVKQSHVEKNIAATREMGSYRASTLVDFERGRPLELEALFMEPLRKARSSGLPTPRLNALCRILEGLNAIR